MWSGAIPDTVMAWIRRGHTWSEAATMGLERDKPRTYVAQGIAGWVGGLLSASWRGSIDEADGNANLL